VQRRIERRDLLHQPVDEFLCTADRQCRNVVDGLVRIQLGALTAGRGQGIDQVAGHAQEAQFEYLEETAGAGANDQHFGDDGRLRGNLGQTLFLQGGTPVWGAEL
jgi:hypothetical protein